MILSLGFGGATMPVLGVGGIFFRARQPGVLAAWYREHLGIGADGPIWEQAAGPAVFAPFDATTDYFPADRQFMLNLRVSGLDALIEALRAAGIEVITKAEWDTPETGRFARIHDPEGSPIELWEPPPD
jgi:catechol 2,3-dioxygenase-like lactoylglutathione lyase family enzyme